MRTQTRIQEFFQRGAGGLSVVFFPFSSRRPFPSPFFSDLRSTWTVPISSSPVPSPLFVSVSCGKKYTTVVTPTPWGTGARAFPPLQIAGQRGTVSRRTANKKLAKLY